MSNVCKYCKVCGKCKNASKDKVACVDLKAQTKFQQDVNRRIIKLAKALATNDTSFDEEDDFD